MKSGKNTKKPAKKAMPMKSMPMDKKMPMKHSKKGC